MPDGRRVTPVYRNIAALNITEQDDSSPTDRYVSLAVETDTIDARAYVNIVGEARTQSDDELHTEVSVLVGASAREKASPDQLLALGVHLGIDDDEEALALLLDDDEE